MMAHYDDETLITLLDAADDPHIAECAECRASLEEYRVVTSSLAEDATWDLRVLNEEPVAQTIANLQSYASMMRAEDEAAVPLVAELLAGPREEWMPRLLSDDKYRTAGVVRKLMEESDRAIDVMPPDALEISALATEIADKLDPAQYPSDTVMKLRGNAWRDRGYCLYRCSQFGESATTLDLAERLLTWTAVADYDLARLGIARAVVERSFENFPKAISAAASSCAVFKAHGDTNKMASALLAAAQAKWKSGRSQEALDVLLRLNALQTIDDDTRMRLFVTVAVLYRDMGDTERSLEYFTQARFANDEIGNCNELVIQWSIAILLVRVGAVDKAEAILLQISEQFETHRMFSEAAQVGLNLAEIYADRGRYHAVEMLCKKAIDFYSRAGLPATERLLNALTYLAKSAQQKQATSATVRQVSRYLSNEIAVLDSPSAS